VNKLREDAIQQLAIVYRTRKDAGAIQGLVVKLRPFFPIYTKS